MNCATCHQPILEGQALKFQSVAQHQNPSDCVAATARRCAEIADKIGAGYKIQHEGEYEHHCYDRLFASSEVEEAIRREFPAAFVSPEGK